MALSRKIRVGAFVLLGLSMAGLVVFLIGDERQMFKPKASYVTTFTDVEGLKRGSPVRMGGVDIGTVGAVAYGEDAADTKLYVTLVIVGREASRIREGSVARVDNKGLLGDKLISITPGSADKEPIPPGGVIPSETAGGMSEMVGKLGNITAKVEQVMGNLEKTSRTLADDELQQDLRQSTRSVAGILKKLDEQQGYAGKLLGDPEEAEKLSRALTSLERTGQELSRTLQGVNAIVRRIEQGPGFAHDLIYEREGSQALGQFGRAAEEVGLSLRGIREGNGLARAVLYGGDGVPTDAVMSDLAAISHDLRQVVAGVRAGRGTIGALLVDPSVYEDLKLLLGNVERNKTLRALVRYSIRRDEKLEPVQVRDPAPTTADPAPGQ